MIAFVRDNNIFLVKLLYGNSESKVTEDGKQNSIINGIPDWVYEEEFGFNRALEFSADNTMIALSVSMSLKFPPTLSLYLQDKHPTSMP